MKKSAVILLVFLSCCFLFSCVLLLEPERTEKIKIDNQTDENVNIYYKDFSGSESFLTTVHSKDSMFVYVSPGTEYYAIGRSTGKDYGKRTFVKAPSYVYDTQTWVIRN